MPNTKGRLDEEEIGKEIISEESESKTEIAEELIPNEKDTTSATDKKDRMDAIIDQLKTENAKLKAINIDALVAEGVKTRLALLNKASSIMNTDELIDKTDREIMEIVIKTQNSNFDLKEKSDAYISGRFDAIVEGVTRIRGIKNQMSNLINTDGKEELSGIDILRNHSKRRA